MKTLPTKFTKNGSTFEQMERSGQWAIYLRSVPNQQDQWEVVRIKSHNGREIGGKVIEPAEFYPSANAWGMDGFTLTTWKRAQSKFAEMAGQPATA